MEDYLRDYSENEKRMFKALGWDEDTLSRMEVTVTYRVAAETCFVDDARGNAVDALRRGIRALLKRNPYRGTPEHEALIHFN